MVLGYIVAEYEPEENHKCENRIQVCKGEVKEVHLNVKILRMKKGGDPVALPTDVLLYDIPRTQERFAQCCMTVTATVETVNPPRDVNLKDGLQIGVPLPSREERVLYDTYGTPDTTDDIVVFYVNEIRDPLSGSEAGWNVPELWLTDEDMKYANNVLISQRKKRMFTLPHELMHLLLNAFHDLVGQKGFHLFYERTSEINRVTATKRITPSQCGEMRKSHLVD